MLRYRRAPRASIEPATHQPGRLCHRASAGAGEALLLCAGERQLISLVASDKENELFTSTAADLAVRNRHRRRGPIDSTEAREPAITQSRHWPSSLPCRR
ncbi:MAG: hypothetical protein JO023_22495 [Chloroflexi bacterium]|nr:hypothetical protein [Chloroflexota bacterium]